MKRVLAFLGFLAIISACKKDPTTNPDDGLTYLEVPSPPFFPAMLVPAGNPLSKEGVALGRKLYYDSRLSLGGNLAGQSCSSCHHQQNGFSIMQGSGMPVLPHVNLGWSDHFLWNGKVIGSLEEVMEFEVSEFFQTDLNYFNSLEEYKTDFKKVFGNEQVTYERLAMALSQFLRTLNSYNSPYDQWLRGEVMLSPLEWRGLELFFSEAADCFHCHAGPLFMDKIFHNTGLDSVSVPGSGHEAISGMGYHRGSFKTPTLRNVAVRGPYMHDGRFQTLQQVIDFYAEGMYENDNLDPLFQKYGPVQRLNLTEYDKQALVAFLEALSDPVFLSDESFSAP
jgi:cytochrome c peroxidase